MNWTNDSTLDNSKGRNWPAVALSFIIILAIGGNVLVCLAVKRERKLHNRFNYFLVSLAFSDMLSALLIMPLSIYRTIAFDDTSKFL